MSKVQKIKIENLKNVSNLEIDFNGCTCILTASNDKGKSTFLHGIQERIRFNRPNALVKEGEKEGVGELVLDSGEKFVWEFDVNGKDKLTYYTSEGIKESVTKALGKKYFPEVFDVDKFLEASTSEQSKQLQKIIGIDFSDVDARYQKAYDKRTEKNRDAEKYHVKLSQMLEVPFCAHVDLTIMQEEKEIERERLNKLYLENKNANEKLRTQYNDAKEAINKKCNEFNAEQSTKRSNLYQCKLALETLVESGYEGMEVTEFIYSLGVEIKDDLIKEDLYPEIPKYIEEMPSDEKIREIDARILDASKINAKADEYTKYIEYKKETEKAKLEAIDADIEVKKIEEERKKMIEGANFPKGVTISNGVITVNGFIFDKKQISKSLLYITALRIASMNVGEVRTLYFDASALDKQNLMEIEKWAHENNLQLLIERASFEESDFKYELIETK